MTKRDLQPYASMDGLRHAHDELFDELPNLSVEERKKADERIEEFIGRAISTGKILDTVNDRREAQGLIDYWVASTFTRPRNGTLTEIASHQGSGEASATTASASDVLYGGRPDNQLETFDPAVIGAAADLGEKFIQSLSAQKRDLARQILFRLIHFPDAGENFTSAPADLDELRKFGNPAEVAELVEGLRGAGVLTVKPAEEAGGGDVVTLRYIAFTRRWKWLVDELKKRMSFRDLALSWVGSGRSNGALLDRKLNRGFREYNNLNEWETEFVNKSGAHATRTVWLRIAVLVPLIAIAGVGTYFNYWVYGSTPSKIDAINREIKSDSTPIANKVEDLKWLARFRLPINIAGVRLDDRELKDLTGLFAPGAVFANTRLTSVRFDSAYLWNASFNSSIITSTSFADARLPRASFDGVEFCTGVDFTNADLLRTNFRQAIISPAHVPVFAKTPWWLAAGLDFDQISLLDSRYRRAASIAEYPRYQAELDVSDRRIEQAKDRPRAVALNEKAWTLSILGIVSDGVAEKAVRDGLSLLDEVKDKSEDDKERFDDTLAYILLQRANEDAALKAARLEEAAGLLEVAARLKDGEVIFRRAVVLFALKRDWKSALENALVEQQYDPTHELLLLKDYITGEFKQRVMDITGRHSRQPPRSRCPPQDNKSDKLPSTTGVAIGDGRYRGDDR
jgi:uncharacterized protein YoaH (UPF0181 family)